MDDADCRDSNRTSSAAAAADARLSVYVALDERWSRIHLADGDIQLVLVKHRWSDFSAKTELLL